MNGFILTINNQNYLFATDKKTKSSKLIKQIKQVLQAEGNLTPSLAFSLRDKLQPACITDDDLLNYRIVILDWFAGNLLEFQGFPSKENWQIARKTMQFTENNK